MTESPTFDYKNFILPPGVATRRDISSLVVELEKVDNDLTEMTVHVKVGVDSNHSLSVSDQLNEFITINKLPFRNPIDRTEIIKQMRLLKDKAPVVHMTFASEPDGDSIQYLTSWMRQSVHSQSVVEASIQPALVAGVYIRTANRIYDFSARKRLQDSRQVLLGDLEALRG